VFARLETLSRLFWIIAVPLQEITLFDAEPASSTSFNDFIHFAHNYLPKCGFGSMEMFSWYLRALTLIN
jgi:hypothetical protein